MEPKHCKAYCGTRWDTHNHNDGGLIFQDMPDRVKMTRCFCSEDCRKAGRALHPKPKLEN